MIGEGAADEAVVALVTQRRAPGGSLVRFIGSCDDPFREATAAVCERAGLDWSYREVDPDAHGDDLDDPAHARAERIAAVVLKATRGGRA